MKVVIEVLAAPTMLGKTCHAWMALTIMADASEVAPSRISQEDVGAEVDGLSRPLEAPASACKFSLGRGMSARGATAVVSAMPALSPLHLGYPTLIVHVGMSRPCQFQT